jgi:hypothetical protein
MKCALIFLGLLLISAPCIAQTSTSTYAKPVVFPYEPQVEAQPLGPTPYEWSKTIPQEDLPRCIQTVSGKGMIVQQCE